MRRVCCWWRLSVIRVAVIKSIDVKLQRPSLNWGGGLRHYSSHTYNAALSSLPRQLDNRSHLGSPTLSNPHDGRFDQQPSSGPNDSVRTLPRRVCDSAPVSQNWRSLLDKRWNVFKRLKHVQSPAMQHLERWVCVEAVVLSVCVCVCVCVCVSASFYSWCQLERSDRV